MPAAKPMEIKRLMIGAVVAMTLSACRGNLPAQQRQLIVDLEKAVRERASLDFGCPGDRVTATLSRELKGRWEAEGCGRSETYEAACSGFNVELQCRIKGSGRFDPDKASGEEGPPTDGEDGNQYGPERPVKKPAGLWGSYVFLSDGSPREAPAPGWEGMPVLEGEPPGDYRAIGLVEAVGRGLNLTTASLVPELKRQAALMGAGAIAKVESNEFNTGGEGLYATAIALEGKP